MCRCRRAPSGVSARGAGHSREVSLAVRRHSRRQSLLSRATGTPPPGWRSVPVASTGIGPGRPAACQPPRRPRPPCGRRASTKPHVPSVQPDGPGNGRSAALFSRLGTKKAGPGPFREAETRPSESPRRLQSPQRPSLAALRTRPAPPGTEPPRRPAGAGRGSHRRLMAAVALSARPRTWVTLALYWGVGCAFSTPPVAVGRRSALSAAPPVRKHHRRVVSPDHVTFHPAIEIAASEHDAGANADPRQRLIVDCVLVEGPAPQPHVCGRVWCGQPLPSSLFFFWHPAHPERSPRRASRAKRKPMVSSRPVKSHGSRRCQRRPAVPPGRPPAAERPPRPRRAPPSSAGRSGGVRPPHGVFLVFNPATKRGNTVQNRGRLCTPRFLRALGLLAFHGGRYRT